MGGIIVGSNDNDPVIPPAQAKRALAILNVLNRHVRVMRRFDARINNLHLFDDFVNPNTGDVVGKSRILWHDHPTIQLVLTRRDRYEEITRQLKRYEQVLEDTPAANKHEASDKFKAIDAIAKLRYQQHKELEALEIAMQDVRKSLQAHLHTSAKFVTDMAKVVQAEKLIRSKTGGGIDGLTDAQVDAVLADDP